MGDNALTRWMRRLRTSEAELADQQQRARSEGEGMMQIATCKDRDRVVVMGTLKHVTINPQCSDKRWLEAQLDDGSGGLTLVWMGRRTIPGVDAGRRVRAQGRVAYVEGRKVIYNPYYELLN